MIETSRGFVNILTPPRYAKFGLSASKKPLVGHRWSLASSWLFHQEQQRQHQQEHPAEEPVHIVVRKDSRLPLQHSPQRTMSLSSGRRHTRTFRDEGLAKSAQRSL